MDIVREYSELEISNNKMRLSPVLYYDTFMGRLPRIVINALMGAFGFFKMYQIYTEDVK